MISSLFLVLEGTGYLNLIVIGISLLAILIPLLCGYDFSLLDESPVNNAIMSPQAQTSYGILLVSIIPSVIDTALDYNNLFHPLKWKKYIFGRIPIVVTGLLVSVQFFVITDTPSIFGLTTRRTASYLLSLSCLKIVFTGSMMIILTSIKPSVFSRRVTFLFTLLACTVFALRAYTPGSSAWFHQFSNNLSYIFLVVVVLTLVYWMAKLVKALDHMTVPDYICALYLLIYFVGIFGSYIHVFLAWSIGEHVIDFSTMTALELATTNYCYTFVFIMMSIAPGRIARFEAVTYLVSRHNYISRPHILTDIYSVYPCLCSIIS